MKSIPSYGVIVGRFQVPELHDGHLELFRAVRERHERVIVFVGVTAMHTATKRNPLDFETRRRMIQAKFPEFSVHPLQDKRTDQEWSTDLDSKIREITGSFGEITLYGARDSFVPHYNGRHRPVELVLTTPVSPSGSDIRASLTNAVKESYDFRAGIIYALNNSRPRIETTVDVAILYNAGSEDDIKTENIRLLLARKPGFNLWRFVGGFVEPDSEMPHLDAVREAYEETGLSVNSLDYVWARKVDDWRYAKEEDKIQTMLFVGWSNTMGGKAADDIAELQWFNLKDVRENDIVPEHRQLFRDFMDYVEIHYKGLLAHRKVQSNVQSVVAD